MVGEVLPMGTFEGDTEVLYAARLRGTDLRTGKGAEVDVLMAGIDDGTLRRTVWALQPGTEPGDPDVRLVRRHQVRRPGRPGFHYGVIGYVAGEHDVVEVTLPDGSDPPRQRVQHPRYCRAARRSTTPAPGRTDWSEFRADLAYGVPGDAVLFHPGVRFRGVSDRRYRRGRERDTHRARLHGRGRGPPRRTLAGADPAGRSRTSRSAA